MEKRNKCDVTIKSTIIKRTISGKNKWLKHQKNPPKEKQNWGERERVLTSFVLDNLEGIEERSGNEIIIINLYKN